MFASDNVACSQDGGAIVNVGVHWLCLCWQPVVTSFASPSDSVVEMPACKECLFCAAPMLGSARRLRCAFPGSEFCRGCGQSIVGLFD